MHGWRLVVYKMFLLLNDYSMSILKTQEIIFLSFIKLFKKFIENSILYAVTGISEYPAEEIERVISVMRMQTWKYTYILEET